MFLNPEQDFNKYGEYKTSYRMFSKIYIGEYQKNQYSNFNKSLSQVNDIFYIASELPEKECLTIYFSYFSKLK